MFSLAGKLKSYSQKQVKVMLNIFYKYIILSILVTTQLFSQTLNWQQLHAPVTSSITGITKLSNNQFYISTRSGGIFKSIDNGYSWTEFNDGISFLNINDIYSTDDNKLFACSGAGIFLYNWQIQEWVNMNAPQADYFSITVNSLGNIIAGSNLGIFRSEDDGNTWQAATTNISAVYSLIIGLNDILFAGTTFGVYKSIDNGNIWTIAGLQGIEVSDITKDKDNNIYANVFYRGEGIYRSTDQGLIWEQINSGLSSQLTTAVAVNSQDDIYAGTFEGGVFQKKSGQPSFMQINMHQSMSQVMKIYVTQNNVLYICSEFGGLFRRDDLNFEWEQVNSGLLMSHAIPLGFDLNDNFYLGNLFSGIYRSTDKGDSWFPIAPYFGGSHLFTFLANDNRLFLGTTIEFAFLGMLFKSTDRGENWVSFQEGIPPVDPNWPWIQPVMDMDVNSQGDLFAALFTSGVYRRLITDSSWHNVNAGLPDTNIFSLCINSDDILFAGFRDGSIYKSYDKGLNWVQSFSGFPDYNVEVLKSVENFVFAILHNSNYLQQDSSIGLYSHDEGVAWLDINVNGLGSMVNSIDLYNGKIICVGTDSNGIFLSSDFGDSWINANMGLSDTKTRGMIIHPDGLLLCGTEDEGIFKADLSPTTVSDINGISKTFLLNQNHPNPFNPTTNIEFSIPKTEFVTLEIYNILGERVTTLVSEKLPAGKYKYNCDAGSLASGIYLYKIQAGYYTETKKMILMR
jgi:photosystem II stability/assembly factor-like uncharacterized protein